jgi:hypothetical protein
MAASGGGRPGNVSYSTSIDARVADDRGAVLLIAARQPQRIIGARQQRLPQRLAPVSDWVAQDDIGHFVAGCLDVLFGFSLALERKGLLDRSEIVDTLT